MASYDDGLPRVAGRLLRRRSSQRGKLPGAQVRRSISTSYYALFHFLIEEAAARLLGVGGAKLRRRRILARTFTHKGLRTALAKMQGQSVDRSIEDVMRGSMTTTGSVASPAFVREIARVFADAQAKRHDADYDRNKALGASDARLL